MFLRIWCLVVLIIFPEIHQPLLCTDYDGPIALGVIIVEGSDATLYKKFSKMKNQAAEMLND